MFHLVRILNVLLSNIWKSSGNFMKKNCIWIYTPQAGIWNVCESSLNGYLMKMFLLTFTANIDVKRTPPLRWYQFPEVTGLRLSEHLQSLTGFNQFCHNVMFSSSSKKTKWKRLDEYLHDENLKLRVSNIPNRVFYTCGCSKNYFSRGFGPKCIIFDASKGVKNLAMSQLYTMKTLNIKTSRPGSRCSRHLESPSAIFWNTSKFPMCCAVQCCVLKMF